MGNTDFLELLISFLLPIHLIICVFVCISSVVLVRREGFRLTRLFGVALTLSYLLGSIFIVIISGLLNTISPKMLMFLKLEMCYANCFFFAVCILGALAVFHKAKYDKDFIIILGCSISKNGGLRPILRERTNRAIHFAWEQEIETGKAAKYIPSGGKGKDEIISEGSAMELYLASHGAEFNEIFPDKQSKNTYENLLFSKEIIDSIMPEAKVAFVTSNFHVLRSKILAGRIGLAAEGIASSTRWYYWPNGFAREFIAILTMYPFLHIAAIIAGIILCLF